DEAREDVVSELVGPEQVLRRRVREERVEVGVAGAERRDQRRRERDRDERHRDDEPEHRERPAQEALAQQAPAPCTARQLDRRCRVGEAHAGRLETRMRGLRSEYTTSTVRFTSTYPAAATSTTPCSSA